MKIHKYCEKNLRVNVITLEEFSFCTVFTVNVQNNFYIEHICLNSFVYNI